MVGGRPQGPAGIDPYRRLRAHSIVVGLSRLGMGHGRRGTRSRLSQALRLGDGAQRSHPPNHAEGRGQRHLSHRHVDRLPAASAGYGTLAGTDESRRRQTALASRRYRRHLQAWTATAPHHRPAAAGLRRKNSAWRTTMACKLCVATALAVAVFTAAGALSAPALQAADLEVKIDQF